MNLHAGSSCFEVLDGCDAAANLRRLHVVPSRAIGQPAAASEYDLPSAVLNQPTSNVKANRSNATSHQITPLSVERGCYRLCRHRTLRQARNSELPVANGELVL